MRDRKLKFLLGGIVFAGVMQAIRHSPTEFSQYVLNTIQTNLFTATLGLLIMGVIYGLIGYAIWGRQKPNPKE